MAAQWRHAPQALPPPDVSDDEWSIAAPQHQHDLREVFNALRWLVHAGAPLRLPLHGFPPSGAVYHQSRRCVVEGSFGWLAARRRLGQDKKLAAAPGAAEDR